MQVVRLRRELTAPLTRRARQTYIRAVVKRENRPQFRPTLSKPVLIVLRGLQKMRKRIRSAKPLNFNLQQEMEVFGERI